jgi:hypothetical protein
LGSISVSDLAERRRLEEALGGAARRRARRRLFEHATGMQHTQPVADLGDDAEIMGDEEEGCARLALQLADETEDLALDGDVERGGRLVGDDEARAAGEGHGDQHALAHAAGQLEGILGEDAVRLPDVDRGEQPLGLGERPAPASK